MQCYVLCQYWLKKSEYFLERKKAIINKQKLKIVAKIPASKPKVFKQA